MLNKKLLAVIVVLLTCVVAYMAIDRSEKNEHAQKAKAFEEKYIK